jgi:Carboxypeptidase regulatory-like domain
MKRNYNVEQIRRTCSCLLQGRFLSLLLFAMLLIALVPAAYGQIFTSSIVGTATDTSGAVIPGANVTLLNVNTGVKNQTKTNSVGDYIFQYLHPGTYTLTADAAGFKKFIRENITIEMYTKVSINVTLQPGRVTQQVTVTASTPLLHTQTGDQSATLANKPVNELPLSRTGTLDAVKLLTPGIYESGVSEGGIVRKDQEYVDGALASQAVWGGNAINPTPDAIQEVKVLSNSFSAVYGNTGGSIEIATTRSGTNKIHGVVYEYLENGALNAGNFITHKVPKLTYNEPGFSVGGPILKNKLFFFGDWDLLRSQGKSTFTGYTVPDPTWRNGDFTNVLGAQVGTDALGRPIYNNEIFNYATQRAVTAGVVDPVTGLVATQTGYVRDPFTPMNMIPQADLNASALLLQKLYPNPTTPGAILQNYNTAQPSSTHAHQYDIKIDYYLRPQDKIMGRWSAYWRNSFGGQPFPGLGGGAYTPIIETGQDPVLDWVHTFGPATTNEVHAAYYHVRDTRLPVGYGQVGLSTFGITGLPNANQPLGVPCVGGCTTSGTPAMGGSSGVATIGSAPDDMLLQGQADIFLDEVLSHIVGKHTLQFGGEVQRMQINNLQPNPGNTSWAFTNDFTNQYTGTGVGSTGFDYASFLLGLPQQLHYRVYPNFADTRASIYAAFAQDAFRVKSNLTLDLGVRWDAPLYWTGVNHTLGSIYTWNGTTANYQKLGVNGFRNTYWNNHWVNFGPRIGIAWSPSWLHNTVFRAGYGLFTMGVQQQGQFGTYPIDPGWYTIFDNGEFNDSLTAALTEPKGLTLSSIPFTPFVATANPNPGITPNNNPMALAQQWNAGFQHAVGGVVFNVAYAASHDTHLQQNGYSINVIQQDLWSTCQGNKFSASGTQCVAYPQYNIGALGLNTWIGENSYNSLQITATKHFSQGLSFLAGYTWAKNLNVGENGYRFPLTNRYADRAWDVNTVPQRFTLAYVYALPFGKGTTWLTRGPLVPILGNWQVSGVTTLQSGYPLSVSGSNTCPGCGNSATQPNLVGNPVPSGFTQNTAHWFDPNAFKEPASLWTVGNAGYSGLFFGPGETNFDISLSKRFYFPKLGESKNLQFRADFFNAFNHPYLSNPNTNLQSSAVGTISSARNSPRLMEFALKFYF